VFTIGLLVRAGIIIIYEIKKERADLIADPLDLGAE